MTDERELREQIIDFMRDTSIRTWGEAADRAIALCREHHGGAQRQVWDAAVDLRKQLEVAEADIARLRRERDEAYNTASVPYASLLAMLRERGCDVLDAACGTYVVVLPKEKPE